MTKSERAGLGFALAEILAVGLVPAFSKYAVSRIDPLLYSAAAVLVAAAVSFVLAAGRGEAAQLFKPALLPRLLAIALLGTTATTLLLFYGARLTDGVSAALLLQSEPIFSLAMTWILWRRTLPLRQLAGTGLVMAGIVLVLYDGSMRIGIGGALILLAPVGWQLSHFLALQVMPEMGPHALTAARYLYGGAALVLIQALVGRSSLTTLGAAGASMALFHGVVLFFCGTLFWYETIKRIDLPRATAIVTPCEPLISLILVWVILRDLPTLWQTIGIVLLLPGMFLVVSRGRPVE